MPTLVFLLAAATYPMLRDATQESEDSASSGSRNPFFRGVLTLKDTLLKPLSGKGGDAAALRTAQQDAYAVKAAEHKAGSAGGGRLGGKRMGVDARLPNLWDDKAMKQDEDAKGRQVWDLGRYATLDRRVISHVGMSGA